MACNDPYTDLKSKDAADYGNKLRAVGTIHLWRPQGGG